MSLAEVCSEWKIDPETLLTRLRAGLPSVQADDFESGEDFNFLAVRLCG